MTFKSFIELLKSRIWLIILLPLIAAGVAAYFSAEKPTTYSAKATLLVDYRKPLEGELAGEMLPVGLQQGYMATQVDIIKSTPVAKRAFDIVDLGANESWRARYESRDREGKSFEEWALSKLKEYLRVTVGSETRLIEVWFQDSDPVFAAAVANAYVEAFRELNRELGREPATQTASSVETLLGRLRAELEEAERRVSTYQAKTGILTTDERLDVETAHLSELMEQKLAAEAQVRSLQAELGSVANLQSTDAGAIARASEVLNSDLIQDLQIDLSRKQAEVAEASASLGERHPDMQKLRAELRSLQNEMAIEMNKAAERVEAQAEQARLLAESASEAEAAQRAKVLELKTVRDGLQPLLRELESARASYDRALEMYSEYAMHSNLYQTNVSILSAAEVPPLPSSPSMLRNVLIALGAGFIFAIGLVLLWELGDSRVRTSRDASSGGRSEYLGALPKA